LIKQAFQLEWLFFYVACSSIAVKLPLRRTLLRSVSQSGSFKTISYSAFYPPIKLFACHPEHSEGSELAQ
jgi:hypothetical protein